MTILTRCLLYGLLLLEIICYVIVVADPVIYPEPGIALYGFLGFGMATLVGAILAFIWTILAESPQTMKWWRFQCWLWIIFGVPLISVGIGLVLIPVAIFTLRRKSSWGWLVGTLFSLNPMLWSINGIYLWRRLNVLGENKAPSYRSGSVKMATIVFIGSGPLILLTLLILGVTAAIWPASDTAGSNASPRQLNTTSLTVHRKLPTPTPPSKTYAPSTFETDLPKLPVEPLKGRGYSIVPPVDWASLPLTDGYDLKLSDNPVESQESAGFNISENEARVTEAALLSGIGEQLRSILSKIHFSQPEHVEIDNRQWVHFTADGIYQGIFITFDEYLFSGQEGTFQLAGLYSSNRKERYAPLIDKIAYSFRFETPAGRSASEPAK